MDLQVPPVCRQALTPDAPARERATALLLAGWLEASAGNVALAESDLDGAADLAAGLDDPVLVADVERHRAFLAIQQGRPGVVLDHAATSLATYRPLDLPWRTAASLLLSAYGHLMVGDTAAATADATEAVGALEPIGDSWGMVHAEAMLAGSPRPSTATTTRRALSPEPPTSPPPWDSSARPPCTAPPWRGSSSRLGDPAALASFEQAIRDALSVGDGRLTATARLNLARLLRGVGQGADAVALFEENERWYKSAGGGDFALLTDCMLAAERRDEHALRSVLDAARATGNLEVQVFALDAQARLAAESRDRETAGDLLAESDRLAAHVAHVVDKGDRIDAAAAGRVRW